MSNNRKKPECHTYFRVVKDGPLDVELFCAQLGISASNIRRYGEPSPLAGHNYGFTSFEIGYNDSYDVYISDMLRVTLIDLFGKESLLKELKDEYGLSYYLVRVPTLVGETDEPRQCLSLDPDIVDFLAETGTQDDLDLYII